MAQSTKRRRDIAKNFNRLSRVQERYGQTDRLQTDGGNTKDDAGEARGMLCRWATPYGHSLISNKLTLSQIADA